MPQILTPYDTSIGSKIIVKNLEKELNDHLVTIDSKIPEYEFLNGDNIKFYFIAGKDNEAHLPIFNHPFLFESFKKEKYLVSDVRSFINKRELEDNLLDAARDQVSLRYTINRAILTMAWIEEGPGFLTNLYKFSGKIFSNWITGSLGNVLALDPAERLYLTIVAHHYYQIMCTLDKVTDSNLNKFMFSTTKLFPVNITFVKNVYEALNSDIVDMNGLVENIKAAIPGPKTDYLNIGTMLNAIVNGWFGPNAQEALPISLEHPPTWISIVYASMTEKTYRRSNITRIIDNNKSKGMDKIFIQELDKKVENYLA
jgi:hypothetical protein